MARIRVVIADDLKLQRKIMLAAFLDSDRFVVVGEAGTGAELVEIAKREKPDLILTDLNMPVMDGAQALRILSFVIPSCVFVVLSAEEDIERLRPVISAGASDFLRKPVRMTELAASLEVIYDREAPRKIAMHGSASVEGARVIGVIGAQAGSGASTVAANLAVALGHTCDGKAALLDFDFQSATSSELMGVAGEKGIVEFLQQEEAVTTEAVDRYLQKKHGITVLPGTPFPFDAARRDPEILTTVIDVLTPEFKYIVVDLEPRMDQTNLSLIGRCDRIYLVVANDLANIRSAARWVAVYTYTRPPEDKCVTIYNHAWGGAAPPRRHLKETIGLPIVGEISHDPANATAAAQAGKPVILDQEASVSAALRKTFEELIQAGI